MKKNFLKILISTLLLMSSVTFSANAETNQKPKEGFKDNKITEKFKKGNKSTYLELGDKNSNEKEKNKYKNAEIYYKFKEGKVNKNEYLKLTNSTNEDEEYIKNAITFEESQMNSRQATSYEIEDKISNTGNYTDNKGGLSRAASNMIWDLYQYPQEKNYYCGPSTAKSILNARGANISQSTLASYTWLETEHWGETPWWVGSASGGYNPMQYTLNNYLGTTYYTMYKSNGNVEDVKYRVIFSIDRDYGIAGNIWEPAGQEHLPGHPRGADIFHWIPIDGYYDNGNTIHYAEPVYKASSVSWSPDVKNAYYNVSASTMAYVLDGRGLIW